MLEAIFSWLLSGIADAFDAIFNVAIDIANLSLSDFVKHAPIVGTLYIILRDVGLGLIAALFCYHLIKYFTGDISGVRESPIKMLGRSAIAVALVFWGNNVLEFIMNLFTYPYQQLANIPNSHYDFANDVIDGLQGETYAEAQMESWTLTLGAVPMLLITLVAVIVLAVKVISLLIEIVERYLLLNTLVFTSPIIYPTVASEGTMQIFRSWVSMFLGQCVLMLMNVWSLKVLISILNANSASPTDYLVKLFIAVSFCKIASRLDSYMQMLGINVGTTGGSMLLDIAVAGRAAAGLINGLAGFGGGGGSRSMSGKGASVLGLSAAKNAKTVAGAFWGGGGGIGATVIAKAGVGIRGGISGFKSGAGIRSGFREAVDKTINHGFTIDGKGNVTGLSSASMKQGLSIGQDRNTGNPIIQGPQAAQAQFMAQNLARKNLSPQEKAIMNDTIKARDAGFVDKAILSSPNKITDAGINNAALAQMTAGTTAQNNPREHISFSDSVENTDNPGFKASKNTLAGFAATVNGEQTGIDGNIQGVTSGNGHISGTYKTKNETVPVLDAKGKPVQDAAKNNVTEQKDIERKFDICNQAGYDALPAELKDSYSAFRGSDGKTRYINMTEVSSSAIGTNMDSSQSSNISDSVANQDNTVEPSQQPIVSDSIGNQSYNNELSQQPDVSDSIRTQSYNNEPSQQPNVSYPGRFSEATGNQAVSIDSSQQTSVSESVINKNYSPDSSLSTDSFSEPIGNQTPFVESSRQPESLSASGSNQNYSSESAQQSRRVSEPTGNHSFAPEPSQQPSVSHPKIYTERKDWETGSLYEPTRNQTPSVEPSSQPRSVSEPVTNKSYAPEPSRQPRSVSEPMTNKSYTSEPSRQPSVSESVTRKVNITETSYQTRASEVSQQPSQPNPASYKSHSKPPKFKGNSSPSQSVKTPKGNQNKK